MYSHRIAVTRTNEVPEFGPAIPEQWMKKGSAFRHFLLTKREIYILRYYVIKINVNCSVILLQSLT